MVYTRRGKYPRVGASRPRDGEEASVTNTERPSQNEHYMLELASGVREIIASEIGKALQEILPPMFAQMKGEMENMIDAARARGIELGRQVERREVEQSYAAAKEQEVGNPKQGKREHPKCKRCRRMHLGECRFGSANCYRCGKPGHISKECKTREVVCFNCSEKGHVMTECRKLTVDGGQVATKPPLRITEGRNDNSNTNRNRATNAWARAFQLAPEETRGEPDVVTGTFW